MKIRIYGFQIICVVTGLACFGFLKMQEHKRDSQEFYLERGSYGAGAVTYQLWVDGLAEKLVPIQVELRERMYAEEEINLVFDKAFTYVKERMIGNNTSLSEIQFDLVFTYQISEYGITAEWTSENPDLIDSFGKVYNDSLTENKAVLITVQLSDGVHSKEEKIQLVLTPASKNIQQKNVDKLLAEIFKRETESRSEKGILLPVELEGRRLRYREESKSSKVIVLLLGVIMAALWPLKKQQDQQQRELLRKKQLQIDYVELVSLFIIFLGAGMSTRKIIEWITKDYEKQNAQNKRRYLYEELAVVCSDIKNGDAEGQSLLKFGRKCRLNCYMRFTGIIDQNRRVGNKQLRNLLELELKEALEIRKQVAKKSGEEAATKLLLPLFLELMIVMGMVMIPALWSLK